MHERKIRQWPRCFEAAWVLPDIIAGHTWLAELDNEPVGQARCQYLADTNTTGHGGLPTPAGGTPPRQHADRAMITAWVRAHQARQFSAAG